MRTTQDKIRDQVEAVIFADHAAAICCKQCGELLVRTPSGFACGKSLAHGKLVGQVDGDAVDLAWYRVWLRSLRRLDYLTGPQFARFNDVAEERKTRIPSRVFVLDGRIVMSTKEVTKYRKFPHST